MVTENDAYTVFIMFFNIIILIGLPIMPIWHGYKAIKMFMHSYDWQLQIFIIFIYILAINAEIPALLSRWKVYYTLKINLPDSIYVLNAWDREGHAIFYGAFIFLTVIITNKKMPKIITDTIG